MLLSGLHVLMACVVTAIGQVPTVTWNGSVITGPVLIYHDEVLTDTAGPPYTVGDPNRPGALVCRTEIETTVAWFWPHDNFVLVPGSNRGFHQVRTPNDSISLLSRTTNYMASTATGSNRNGLWTCRLREEWIPIGLFNRREGFGAITGNPEVTLLHSSAPLNPQAFVLAADTSGGPPTSYIWTRDNNEISGDNEDFSISIAVFNESDVASYENSRYRSTLTVTERRQEGMYTYQYSVTNRATAGDRTDTLTVQVLAGPTEVVVEEAGFQSVRISWIAPSTQTPDKDYSLLFDSSEGNTTTLTATSSPHTVFLQPGVYSLLIVAASQNVIYEIPSPVNFTILGHSLPELTAAKLTATSVVVSWSQPALSLPVAEYTVSVRHAAGSGLCGSTGDTRPEQNMSTNATSHTFNDLQEFSNYTATVVARFTKFSIITIRSSSYSFTTLSASPSGPPLDVNIISVTSRSIEATWDAVACIERNGMITGYRVEVQEQSGHKVIDEIVESKTFTATELTPYTDYIFRVAGVNSNGTGPFSNITTSTDEDTPGAVSALVGRPTLTTIELSWGHPEEPNGVIIDYEVNYSINGTYYNASGLMLEYTISSLQPGTEVSQISIVAYTLLGPGIVAMSDDVTTLHEPPMVLNVTVEMISAESVRVTWDHVDLPEISAYILYYEVIGTSSRQDTSNLPSSSQSSTINGLIPGEVYIFQVAAIADFSQSILRGKKSLVSRASLVTLKAEVVPTVVRVEVKVESSDSVSVSWATSNFTQIAGYFIYYSQTGREVEDGVEASLFVSNSTDTVVVENLLSGVEYQFQVAATTADPHGEKRIGQRSPVSTATLPADGTLIRISLGVSGLAISAAAIIVTLCSLVFITGCCIKCVCHSHRAKFDVKQFDETAATVPPTSTNTMELDENIYDEAIYDEVDERSKSRRCFSMAIGKNAAYVKSKK